MWKLKKPNLNTALEVDIDNLITHCRKLTPADKGGLQSLYKLYDNQNGLLTDQQYDAYDSDKAEAILGQYRKTRKGGVYHYIRDELNATVGRCPYCGINQPDTLDHYMPESIFKALAVCRLNLVPLCSRCNNLKLDKPFARFIHCYYQQYPDNIFLLAKVFTIKQRWVVTYSIDETAIPDKDLYDKIVFQCGEIELKKRLQKEALTYLDDLCGQCVANSNDELRVWLKGRLNYSLTTYGKNDWRTALLRGLLAYPKLDIGIVAFNKVNTRSQAGA